MAKGNGGGVVVSQSSYNETGTSDTPEQMDPYFSYSEVHKNHLSSSHGDMKGSTNSRSGEGIMGHGAPGEPHAGKGGHSKK